MTWLIKHILISDGKTSVEPVPAILLLVVGNSNTKRFSFLGTFDETNCI
jgi:hypothetical protein